MARILVVEDNRELAFGLTTTLEMEGHHVVVTDSGPGAMELTVGVDPHLIILDVMLPGYDGFRVVRTLRENGHDMPVLMLTARATQEDVVRGLRLGADDYMTKPFGAMELLARVDVLLRRPQRRTTEVPVVVSSPANLSSVSGGTLDQHVIRFGDTEILTTQHIVRRGGQIVNITPKSYELLVALATRDGRVASRIELLRDIWGYGEDVTTRTVDLHVAELRRKLEVDSSRPQHIITVRKVGYRLAR